MKPQQPLASPPGEQRLPQLETVVQPVLWVGLVWEVGATLQREPVLGEDAKGCSAALLCRRF